MSKELSIREFLPAKNDSGSVTDRTFVGIDFGTSTTVVSIATFNNTNEPIHVKTIDIKQKLPDGTPYMSYKMPSVIAWYKEQLLFGEGAKQLKFKLRQGKNLWHSFKMELGEDVGCKYPNSDLGKEAKYTILNPVDASKLFFKYLKVQIDKYVTENNLSSKLEFAVSIPASFEANQRRDLIESLSANGIDVSKQSLIDEPNAAFLSYVTQNNNSFPIHITDGYYPNVLVFDFGAGTCDISILEVGTDNNGVYSKNIAVSRFEKLGGDDLDRLIAVDVLLPQLLDGSGLSVEDFRTREINEHIVPKLLACAERLKVLVSERFALQLTARSLPEVALSKDYESYGRPIEIDTKHGVLRIDEPKLSYKEFAGINAIFTKQDETLPSLRIEKELEFVSIFNPIKSALKKAKLSKEDIDYVLFIGGSSKNPFIINEVGQYFGDAEKLVPNDLQAHVSSGASIHSLIYNGFGKNVIQPITSEPIMLITKDGYRDSIEPIVEAGTVIPSDVKTINNLSPQKDGQEMIELPICVGSKNKLLYNIKLTSPDSKGFSLSTDISLHIEINADKLLMIKASAGNKKVMVEPLSPFANKELSTEDRIRLKAEREFNLECERNGGEPTYEALHNLYQAYKKVGLEFKAAETLEQIDESFPDKANLNNLGLHYSNAGKTDKALKFYEKSMVKSPSATTSFNMAIQYKNKDKVKYQEYLEKAHELNPKDNPTAYSLGQHYINQGKKEEGTKLLNESFDRWQTKFERNEMESWDYSWFASCAEALGKKSLAEHILENEPKKESNKMYSSENLTQFKGEQGLTKI